MATAHAVFHPLRVQAIEPLTDDAVSLTFEVPDDLREAYTFAPGQHLTIGCDDGVRRSYSICSPAGSGVLRVGIKRLPGGAFSGAVLDRLRPGDQLDVMTPTGRFGPAPDPTRRQRYAAVAAGSGITPLLSIVASLLEVEPESSVTLVYANRTARSVMFLDEVHDLKDRWPDRLQIVHVFSREPGESDLLSGRLDADRVKRLLETLVPADTVDQWFLCGPQAMVEEVRGVLREHGVDEAAVHTELFHADPVVREPVRVPDGAPDGAAEVTITLDGRTSQFPLHTTGVPVLEAALAVRPDAPFACRGGVCGTCRARVVEGSAVMDTNWALEPGEVERGYVLTCQAHPTSERLVLDYDG